MKQSLQLRLGQQLTMTPQLQQAIRLLQLPTLELRMEIQQALDSNLMLEDDSIDSADEPAREGEESGQGEESVDASERDVEMSERMDQDLAVDSTWDDVYDGSTAYSQPGGDEERDLFENQSAGDRNLREHLLWQLRLAVLTERDLAIAEAIVDAVRDDGYLDSPLEEIQAGLPAAWEATADDMEAVLRRVQYLDPVGVASRNPREALLIQIDQLPAQTEHLEVARQLIDRYLELLVSRQYAQLKRRLRVSQEALQDALELVQTLDPRPGSQISNQRTEYVVPDVFVRRDHEGQWHVEVNIDAYPRLRVNSYYASLVRRADSGRDNSMMRQHLQEARWLIKSLRSRNETLLKVAECIVARQAGFLDHGEVAMEPLVLREVAETIEMHESTVSRITNQKYMHTPRGTYEFKYFFSSHVQTVDGGECSATAIRARIRGLIGGENPAGPLSDSKLADRLREAGIDVARRTVAKYRESMGISSSTERKRLA